MPFARGCQFFDRLPALNPSEQNYVSVAAAVSSPRQRRRGSISAITPISIAPPRQRRLERANTGAPPRLRRLRRVATAAPPQQRRVGSAVWTATPQPYRCVCVATVASPRQRRLDSVAPVASARKHRVGSVAAIAPLLYCFAKNRPTGAQP